MQVATRRAMIASRCSGRRVADVPSKPSPGSARAASAHVAVAGDLGDHRGGGDRGAAGVAVDDRPVLDRAARAEPEAVDQAHGARDARRARGSRPSAFRLVTCRPRESMPRDAADRDRDLRRGPQHGRVERLALLLGCAAWSRRGRPSARRSRSAEALVGRSARRRRRAGRRASRGRPRRRRRRSGSRAAVEAEELRGAPAAALGRCLRRRRARRA